MLLAGMAWGRPAFAADPSGDWAALRTTVFRSVGEVPGGSVTALAQDRDGYLWAGGESGLSRWDGYNFRSYTPDRQIPGWINVLHADRDGRLWIGTNSGGLARYEPAGDRFVTYPAGRAGPSANSVFALADDGANGLWIGTAGGLDHRIDRTGEFEHFRHDARSPGSLPDNVVLAVLRDERGTLWVATDGGLARRGPGSDRFVAVPLPTAEGQRPVPSVLYEDSAARLWVGTHRNGVYVIGRNRRGAIPFLPRAGGEAGAILKFANVRAINEVSPGHMWFGTLNHGIVSADVPTGRLGWMHNDVADPTSLPEDSVFSIYGDRAGLVWVGTLSGLRRADPRQTAISTLVAGLRPTAALAGAEVTAVWATPKVVWLGFRSGGTTIIEPGRGRIGWLRPERGQSDMALPDVAVRTIAGLPGGPMFVGTDRGLYRVGRDGRELRRIPMPGREPDDVIALRIVAGVLWIGTEGKGLWRLDPRGDAVTERPRRLQQTGLPDNRITVIAPASPGHLWIATFGGLGLLDVRSGRAQPVSADGPNGTRLTRGIIASLLTDRQGRLWVGTFGDGIEVVESSRPGGGRRFVQLSGPQGLPNVNVDAMLADGQGRIWAATDNGMAVIDPATLAVRALHRADGVELRSYFFGAAAALRNGDLLFGSTAGLTVVRPSLIHNWSYAPPVVVTDIRVGGKSQPGGGSERPIVILPQANSLAVEFAALDFSAPEQNRYEYRLDGFDADWTETDSSRRLAAYTNLPPGSYTLELRGSNRNGVWSGMPLSVPISVLPAWHQTIAFRLAEALAFLAIVGGLVQVRTAYLRRHERELEQQVSERTAELQTVAVALGESTRRLEHIAYRDPLTDLPNRRMFTEEFDRLLARAGTRRCTLSLLLIDLDHFKKINDTLGHDVGDALLVEVARRLRGTVREFDCVARLGGDEFAILLAEAHDAVEIERICARIVASFRTSLEYAGIEINASVSVGLATAPQHGGTRSALYKSADLALYEAKRAGRDTWRQFALEPA